MQIASKYQIRQATKDDNETIARLSVICWQHAYKDILHKDFLAALQWQPRAIGRKKFYSSNKTAAGFIVEFEGLAVAFCDTGSARPVANIPTINKTYGEIYAIYVLPEFQKQGIASALCQAACEYLISRGFVRCIIWTLSENYPAIAFYKAIGCSQQAWTKVQEIDGKEQKEIAFTIDLL